MSFYLDFLKTLQRQVVDITNLDEQNVVYSHQANEPLGNYCAITPITPLKRTSSPKTSTLTDDIERIWVTTNYESELRFSFLGNDAISLAPEFDVSFDDPINLENLLRNNISVMRRGDVKYLPELRDTKWINRYVQEFTFAFSVTTISDIDVIDEIEWTDLLGHTHTIP